MGRNFRSFAVFLPFSRKFLPQTFPKWAIHENFFPQNVPKWAVRESFFPQNIPKWVVRESFFQKIICLFYIFFGRRGGGGADFSSIFSSRVKKKRLQKLFCYHEPDNPFDEFAIKVCEEGKEVPVGHLPREISRVTKNFIDRRGKYHSNFNK